MRINKKIVREREINASSPLTGKSWSHGGTSRGIGRKKSQTKE